MRSIAKVIEICQTAMALGVPGTAEFKAGGASLAVADEDLIGASSKLHEDETEHYSVVSGNPALTTAINFPLA